MVRAKRENFTGSLSSGEVVLYVTCNGNKYGALNQTGSKVGPESETLIIGLYLMNNDSPLPA